MLLSRDVPGRSSAALFSLLSRPPAAGARLTGPRTSLARWLGADLQKNLWGAAPSPTLSSGACWPAGGLAGGVSADNHGDPV